MKIAICLSGYIGWTKSNYDHSGKTNKNTMADMSNKQEADPKVSFNSIKNKIVDVNKKAGNEVDFFIHTWSFEKEDELKDLYKPKVIKAEPQDKFDQGELDDFGSDYKPGMKWNNKFRCYSKFNSMYKSLKPVREYETKHNFKYDYVLSTRLDMVYRSDLLFTEDKFEKDIIWIGDNPHVSNTGHGRMNDMIFFSGSDIMYGFVEEYKNINQFSKINTYHKHRLPVDPHLLFPAYCKAITNKLCYFWLQTKNFNIIRLIS